MKKWTRFLSYVLVAAAASAVTFFLADRIPTSGASKLVELEDLIQEQFIGEVDQTAIEDAAAAAMVDALGDRWSYYIPAAEYEAYAEQMANTYVGVGITVSTQGTDSIEILQVVAGGPAEEAGLLPGDRIVAVEGERVEQLGVSEATDRIRGQEGTQVQLTISRNGEKQTISVLRKSIQVTVAEGQLLESGIGLITITNFDTRCAQETIDAIEALREQGAKALIFDVRGNPGGYKSELVKVLDYLLPEGALFRSQDYTGREEVDRSDAAFLDMPMAVLVNGSSYSAAEFFAAALREYEAATVVGLPTVGKGYFQYTIRLSDGSAVGLSVGKYFTPNGVSLANVGITPDTVVELDEDTARKLAQGALPPEEDPQITAAVEALLPQIP